jgi:hypothetical protein
LKRIETDTLRFPEKSIPFKIKIKMMKKGAKWKRVLKKCLILEFGFFAFYVFRTPNKDSFVALNRRRGLATFGLVFLIN